MVPNGAPRDATVCRGRFAIWQYLEPFRVDVGWTWGIPGSRQNCIPRSCWVFPASLVYSPPLYVACVFSLPSCIPRLLGVFPAQNLRRSWSLGIPLLSLVLLVSTASFTGFNL